MLKEMGTKSVKMIKGGANWSAKNGAFFLTFLCIIGTLAGKFLGLVADVNTLLPTLLGLYLGQRASQTISAHVAASKDPNCDTAKIIKDMENPDTPPT